MYPQHPVNPNVGSYIIVPPTYYSHVPRSSTSAPSGSAYVIVPPAPTQLPVLAPSNPTGPFIPPRAYDAIRSNTSSKPEKSSWKPRRPSTPYARISEVDPESEANHPTPESMCSFTTLSNYTTGQTPPTNALGLIIPDPAQNEGTGRRSSSKRSKHSPQEPVATSRSTSHPSSTVSSSYAPSRYSTTSGSVADTTGGYSRAGSSTASTAIPLVQSSGGFTTTPSGYYVTTSSSSQCGGNSYPSLSSSRSYPPVVTVQGAGEPRSSSSRRPRVVETHVFVDGRTDVDIVINRRR